MKLYYTPGTCSLSPLIVAFEAGLALDLERVDIGHTPHRTTAGRDFAEVNPNAYVPVLELEDGAVLTEGVAIVQHLADLRPGSDLVPAPGTVERARLQSWLNFVATELHKMYSPWLFHPEYGTQAQAVARDRLAIRLAHVDRALGETGAFLTGEAFTVADAYLFTVANWSGSTGVDLSGLPRLQAYLARVADRPAVREALAAHSR